METFKITSAPLEFNEEPFLFNFDDERIVEDFGVCDFRSDSFHHYDIEVLINEYKSQENEWNGFPDSHQVREINNEGIK